jgi:hypothetical protein
MPSATRVFGLYAFPEVEGGADNAAVEGQSLFRLISSMAHAEQWAILPMTELTDLIARGYRRPTSPRLRRPVGVTSGSAASADATQRV